MELDDPRANSVEMELDGTRAKPVEVEFDNSRIIRSKTVEVELDIPGELLC